MSRIEKINKQKLSEIMTRKISPREIARDKYIAYCEFVEARLAHIAQNISLGCFETLYDERKELFCNNPYGDDMGKGNTFINFGYTDEPIDIKEALNLLAYLEVYSSSEIVPIDMEYDEDVEWGSPDAVEKAVLKHLSRLS